MHWLVMFVLAVTALLWESVLGDPAPKYNPLPPLREQARIQDAWTEERKAGIPALLKKHGVEAWVVRLLQRSFLPLAPSNGASNISQREYAEET
ncbi:hypothetical protein CTA2_614, partial [Colletotrichum tanaceti]